MTLGAPQVPLLYYRRIMVSCVATLAISVALAALVGLALDIGRLPMFLLPPYAAALVLVLALIWMSLLLLRQVVLRDGVAAWIVGARLRTTHWSVNLSDIQNVTCAEQRGIGLSKAKVIQVALNNGKRKYIPLISIQGDGDVSAVQIRKAVSEALGRQG